MSELAGFKLQGIVYQQMPVRGASPDVSDLALTGKVSPFDDALEDLLKERLSGTFGKTGNPVERANPDCSDARK